MGLVFSADNSVNVFDAGSTRDRRDPEICMTILSSSALPQIAVLGAGLPGREYAARLQARGQFAGYVDPTSAGVYAVSQGIEVTDSCDRLIQTSAVQGAIIATTPDETLEASCAALRAGLPILIDPAFLDRREDAEVIDALAADQGLSAVMGWKRRFHPEVRQLRQLLSGQQLGQLVSCHVTSWMSKPDGFFTDVNWSNRPYAGPIMSQLTVDIDLLRSLFGEIRDVSGMAGSPGKGLPIADACVLIVRFSSGLLATVNVADAVAAPFNWHLASGDDPNYSHTDQSCYWIAGTHGSVTMPNAVLWHYGPSGPDWFQRIQRDPKPVEAPVGAEADALLDAWTEMLVDPNQSLSCTVSDALQTFQVLDRIRRILNDL